jgi:hypothetical protein
VEATATPQVIPSGGGRSSVNILTQKAGQVKNWCKTALQKFSGWVKTSMKTIPNKFKQTYSANVGYTANNTDLNDRIKTDLQSGAFKPNVKDWPIFKVPLKDLEHKKLKDVIDKLLSQKDQNGKPINITPVMVKKEFYPQPVAEIITESFILEDGEQQKTNTGTQEKLTKNQELLRNYFLYGTPKPTGEVKTNVLTAELWEETIQNITDAEKAISIGIKQITDDISSTCDDLKNRVNALKNQADDAMNNAINAESNGDASKANSLTDVATQSEEGANRLQALVNIVTEISNEYGIGFAKTLQKDFFETSYKLYTAIINDYKNVTGGNAQQPTGDATGTNAQGQAPANTNTNTTQ